MDQFKKQAASWSRRVVVFVDVIFAVSISNHPPPFFLKSFGQVGGRAGGHAGTFNPRASSCDAAGGSAAPPQPLSVHPPFFLTRARATCSLFLAGNLLDAVRRWRSCADARACSGAPKNERRVCLLVGCSLFQSKRQNVKNKKFKCPNGASAAAAVSAFVLVARVVVVVAGRPRGA